MVHTLFSKRFRLTVIIGIIIGLVGLVISFLPYDVLSPLLNNFARDGSLDLFSRDNWDIGSRFLSFLSGGVFVLSLLTFLAQAYTEPWALARTEGFLTFLQNLRDDMHVLIKKGRKYAWSAEHRLIILILMITAFIPRLASLFIDLEFDEAYLYNAFASHSFWSVITDYHVPNNHVFYTIIVHFLTKFFGNHLWLMRTPSLIAGVLMAPVGYLIARRLYGAGAGVLAGVAISFFPIAVKFSVLVRGYIFISLFALLVMLLADYVRMNKNRAAWAMIAILCGVGLYTVPLMLFPMGSVYIWLFISMIVGDIRSYKSKYDLFKYILWSGVLAVFLMLLFYSPIIYFKPNHLFENTFINPVAWELYPSVMYMRLEETWRLWMSTVPVWITGLGFLGLIASVVFHKKMAKHKVPYQLAFVLWVLGYCLYRRPEMESRMWVYIAAPLLIWASSGIDYLLRMGLDSFPAAAGLKKWMNSGVLVIALLFAVMMIPSIPERWSQKGDIETTVLYLRDNLKKGDMVSTSRNFRPMLQYYFQLYGVSRDWYLTPENLSRAFVLVRSVDGSPNMGDTLEVIAPKDEKGALLVDLGSARILQQYNDMAVYEVYALP